MHCLWLCECHHSFLSVIHHRQSRQHIPFLDPTIPNWTEPWSLTHNPTGLKITPSTLLLKWNMVNNLWNNPVPVPRHCTFWMCPFSETPVLGHGFSTNELLTWIGCVWFGRRSKCAPFSTALKHPNNYNLLHLYSAFLGTQSALHRRG